MACGWKTRQALAARWGTARSDSFHLMPARAALKGADFQTLEWIRRPSNYMSFAVTLATANQRNKLRSPYK